MINQNYLNPILILYEKQVKQLNDEIFILKEKEKNLEKDSNKIINENSLLTNENLFIKKENQKSISAKVLNSNYKIIYDEEFIRLLEGRSNLLSKENEILYLNYQNITKEFYDFKVEVN